MTFKRYAIYYAPPEGSFAREAAEWLGWDPATGAALPHPDWSGLPAAVADLTAEPRKYGFHGTLRAPFRPVEGLTEPDLRRGLNLLASTLAIAEMPGLELVNLDGFLAFVPAGDASSLATLAEEVVRGTNGWRAPLSEAEIARRRPDRLTDRQRDHLARWGYPYVMEDFQFHLTLTGRLDPEAARVTQSVLAERFAPHLPHPFRIADLCLFGEAMDGRFHILHRAALSG
jgi:putative phosphonate metabolism protein